MVDYSPLAMKTADKLRALPWNTVQWRWISSEKHWIRNGHHGTRL